jgi:antitoxin component of RelBE/YafQ-DinJ toxin-antitoxin module
MHVEDMLSHFPEKEKHSQIIQFRVSRTIKQEIFLVMKERNIDLSTVLRSYLKILIKNHFERTKPLQNQDRNFNG